MKTTTHSIQHGNMTLCITEPYVPGVEKSETVRKLTRAFELLQLNDNTSNLRAVSLLEQARHNLLWEARRVIAQEALGFRAKTYTAPIVVSSQQTLDTVWITPEGYIQINPKQLINADADGDIGFLLGDISTLGSRVTMIKWPIVKRLTPLTIMPPTQDESWEDVDMSLQLVDKKGKPLQDWSSFNNVGIATKEGRVGTWDKAAWKAEFISNHTDSGVGRATVNVSHYAIHMINLVQARLRKSLTPEQKYKLLDGFGARAIIEEGLKTVRGGSLEMKIENNDPDREDYWKIFKSFPAAKFNPNTSYGVSQQLSAWLTQGGIDERAIMDEDLHNMQNMFFNLKTISGPYEPKPRNKSTVKIPKTRSNNLAERLIKLGFIRLDYFDHKLGQLAKVTLVNKEGEEIGLTSLKANSDQTVMSYGFLIVPGFIYYPGSEEFIQQDVIQLLNWQLGQVWLSSEERKTFGTTWESLEDSPGKTEIIMNTLSRIAGQFGFQILGVNGEIPYNTYKVASESVFVEWSSTDPEVMADRAWKLYQSSNCTLQLLAGTRGSADSLQTYRIGEAHSGRWFGTSPGANNKRCEQLSSQTAASQDIGEVIFAVVGTGGTDEQYFATPLGVKAQHFDFNVYLPSAIQGRELLDWYNPNGFQDELEAKAVPGLSEDQVMYFQTQKSTRPLGKLIVPSMGLKGTLVEKKDWKFLNENDQPVGVHFVISEAELRAKSCFNAAIIKKVGEGKIITGRGTSRVFYFKVRAARTFADNKPPQHQWRVFRGISSLMVMDGIRSLGSTQLSSKGKDLQRPLLKERHTLKVKIKALEKERNLQDKDRDLFFQVTKFSQQNIEDTVDDQLNELKLQLDQINHQITSIRNDHRLWKNTNLPVSGIPPITPEVKEYVDNLRTVITQIMQIENGIITFAPEVEYL